MSGEPDDDDWSAADELQRLERTPDEYGNWCFNCREFIKDPDTHFKKMSGHNTVKKIIED